MHIVLGSACQGNCSCTTIHLQVSCDTMRELLSQPEWLAQPSFSNDTRGAPVDMHECCIGDMLHLHRNHHLRCEPGCWVLQVRQAARLPAGPHSRFGGVAWLVAVRPAVSLNGEGQGHCGLQLLSRALAVTASTGSGWPSS
jgi:hypothetical protein